MTKLKKGCRNGLPRPLHCEWAHSPGPKERGQRKERCSVRLSSAPNRVQNVDVTYSKGETMYRALGAALLTIAIAAPIQDAAAQDPLGGAILGGAAGAILGGALDGGRGAAIGAIVGGATGAAIAAQGQPRPGGYRYYQQACYQQRGDGAWIMVAQEYCATAEAPPVAVAPPPRAHVRDELRDRMLELRERCEDDDRRACVRLGIIIGENRERRAAWRRDNPEVFFYETER
jgi:outer membrane lipoprotein SlyB